MTDDRAQSEFNMAVSYLNRLNGLLYYCNENAISLDVDSWQHSLLALYRELASEMKPQEREDIQRALNGLNEKITLFHRRRDRGQTSIPPDLYQSMHEIEIALRAVLKSAGLLTRMADDARKALR